MRFCSTCGGPVLSRIPQGDNRERFVCAACSAIHYVNPRIVTGCLVTHGDAILLCRRNIEPRRGFWTFPAGFLETGKTIAEGAVRETLRRRTRGSNCTASTRCSTCPTSLRSICSIARGSWIWTSVPARKVRKCSCSNAARFRGTSWPSPSSARPSNGSSSTASRPSSRCTLLTFHVLPCQGFAADRRARRLGGSKSSRPPLSITMGCQVALHPRDSRAASARSRQSQPSAL